MNKVLTGGVALALVLSGLAFFSAPSETVTERVIERVGAQVGPEHTEKQRFLSGFTVGYSGSDVASSTDDSATTAQANLIDCDIPFVSYTPNLSTTITTMASTAAPFSGLSVGESCEQLWYNASTSAAATITFAAGTGVDLQEDEGGSVIVNGLETARITFFKKADTDIAFIVEPYQVGD